MSFILHLPSEGPTSGHVCSTFELWCLPSTFVYIPIVTPLFLLTRRYFSDLFWKLETFFKCNLTFFCYSSMLNQVNWRPSRSHLTRCYSTNCCCLAAVQLVTVCINLRKNKNTICSKYLLLVQHVHYINNDIQT